MPDPSIGQIVHYVSFGTPGGEFTSECRAAVVAAVMPVLDGQASLDDVDLAVLNPTGLFFTRSRRDENERLGGTWHWPERTS